MRDYSSEVGVGNKVNMALHFDSKTGLAFFGNFKVVMPVMKTWRL